MGLEAQNITNIEIAKRKSQVLRDQKRIPPEIIREISSNYEALVQLDQDVDNLTRQYGSFEQLLLDSETSERLSEFKNGLYVRKEGSSAPLLPESFGTEHCV